MKRSRNSARQPHLCECPLLPTCWPTTANAAAVRCVQASKVGEEHRAAKLTAEAQVRPGLLLHAAARQPRPSWAGPSTLLCEGYCLQRPACHSDTACRSLGPQGRAPLCLLCTLPLSLLRCEGILPSAACLILCRPCLLHCHPSLQRDMAEMYSESEQRHVQQAGALDR